MVKFKQILKTAPAITLFFIISLLFIATPLHTTAQDSQQINLDLKNIQSECLYRRTPENTWSCEFDLKALNDSNTYIINGRESVYIYQEPTPDQLNPCNIQSRDKGQVLLCENIPVTDMIESNKLTLGIGINSQDKFVEIGCTQVVSFKPINEGDTGFTRKPNPISSCQTGDLTQPETTVIANQPTDESSTNEDEKEDSNGILPTLSDITNTVDAEAITNNAPDSIINETENGIISNVLESGIFLIGSIVVIIGGVSLILTIAFAIARKKFWKVTALTCGISAFIIFLCVIGYSMSTLIAIAG